MYHQNFPFEASSWQRPRSYHYPAESTVSPYGYSYQPTQQYQIPQSPPPPSVTDIAEHLRTQTLQANAYAAQQRHYSLPTPPAEDAALASSSEASVRHPSYSCLHMRTSSIRQANPRLQSSSAHLPQISSLVSRMVDSGEQCAICSPGATSTVSSQSTLLSDDSGDYLARGNDDDEEDEGFSEPSPPLRLPDPARNLTYRRSSDFGRSTEGCVAKTVRMRKGRRSLTAGGSSKR